MGTMVDIEGVLYTRIVISHTFNPINLLIRQIRPVAYLGQVPACRISVGLAVEGVPRIPVQEERRSGESGVSWRIGDMTAQAGVTWMIQGVPRSLF